jgi:hypothetical protein
LSPIYQLPRQSKNEIENLNYQEILNRRERNERKDMKQGGPGTFAVRVFNPERSCPQPTFSFLCALCDLCG